MYAHVRTKSTWRARMRNTNTYLLIVVKLSKFDKQNRRCDILWHFLLYVVYLLLFFISTIDSDGCACHNCLAMHRMGHVDVFVSLFQDRMIYYVRYVDGSNEIDPVCFFGILKNVTLLFDDAVCGNFYSSYYLLSFSLSLCVYAKRNGNMHTFACENFQVLLIRHRRIFHISRYFFFQNKNDLTLTYPDKFTFEINTVYTIMSLKARLETIFFIFNKHFFI